MKGKFIVFEGIDGSGKGTQIALLLEKLKKQHIPTHSTFEPTDGPIGSLIRNILRKRVTADEQSIAALFLADRLDHIHNEVNGMLKLLEAGRWIICDRYYFSTYAYHSTHVDMDWLIEANALAADKMRPDLVLYIDLSPEEALDRISKGRTNFDLFENKERLELVSDNYNEAFQKLADKETIVKIKGNDSPEHIHNKIWTTLLEQFPILEGK